MASALLSISATAILFFLLESVAGQGTCKKTLQFALGVMFMALILENILKLLGGLPG